jgi:hypothetical protein
MKSEKKMKETTGYSLIDFSIFRLYECISDQ